MNFWLWACLYDGDAYLTASREVTAILRMPKSPQSMAEFNQRRIAAQHWMELAKYHFVTTLGKLLGILERAQHSFPSIQTAYSNATHLRAEGKDLRDMIEHSDDYDSGRGKHPDRYVREAEGFGANLPGDRPGTADATWPLPRWSIACGARS